MKEKFIIIHDYFDNFGGGERLVNIFSTETGSKIITGFVNNKISNHLNENIYNININFKKNKFLRTIFLIYNFLFLKSPFNSNVVIFSGSYSIFSIRNFKKSKKIAYLHCLPKHIYHNKNSNLLYKFFFSIYSFAFKKIYENSLKKTDMIFCNSEFTKKNLLKNMNINIKKIKIVYPPIDFKKFNKNQIKLNDYFLVNSRHEEDKNIDLIIQSFINQKYKLYISSSGSLTNKLKKISEKYKNVFFLGNLEEDKYIDVLKNSRGSIQLARHEDFGMALTESLACGKMVFCLKSGGLTEYLEDQKNCFFIDPKNIIHDLSVKIDNSSDLLSKNVDFCHESVKKFSKKEFINAFNDEYN